METIEKIKDIAENHIRRKGYNAFSFREIANEMGIKSASIHYYFPTKGDLGAAVAKRYTEHFFAHLPKNTETETSIPAFVNAFKQALLSKRGMCLCGILGAERDSLPDAVVSETHKFFAESLTWLTTAFEKDGYTKNQAKQKAAHLLATLEGALIVARTLENNEYFDLATSHFVNRYS